MLVKESDEHAAAAGARPITEAETTSVATGRTMEEIGKGDAVWRSNRATGETAATPPRRRGQNTPPPPPLDPAALAGARLAKMPGAPAPLLAQRADAVPSGEGWTHEIKFDGYRILALCDGAGATLLSRNGLRWSARFPEIRAALEGLAAPAAVFDGEIVSLRRDGVSGFPGLQDALKRGLTGVLVYMVFDLLHWAGFDLTGCSLADRRAALRDRGGAARMSDALDGRGEEILSLACRLGSRASCPRDSRAPTARAGPGRG